jgi:hypothetical protein
MGFNANDVGFVPAVAGDYIENTGAICSERNVILLRTGISVAAVRSGSKPIEISSRSLRTRPSSGAVPSACLCT